MDKMVSGTISDTSDAASVTNLENACLIHLYDAFENIKKNCESSTLTKNEFFKFFSKLSQERCLDNSGADNAYKVKHAVQYLQDLHGVLFGIENDTKFCVYAKSYSRFSESELSGRHIDQFIHKDDLHQFNSFEETISNSVSQYEQSCCFDCRFLIKSGKDVDVKQDNCDVANYRYLIMKCAKFIERIHMEGATDKTSDSNILLYIAKSDEEIPLQTNKGPPNQTVSTRVKIPQPEKFFTLQDISGAMLDVAINFADFTQRNKPPIPSYMNGIISCSLKSFLSAKHNGVTLHKQLLRQVINQGKGSNRCQKFCLPDGTVAQLLTKSELIHQNLPHSNQQILSTHLVYRESTLNESDLDAKGLPKTLLNCIPVPPVKQSLSDSDSIVTMTTSSIATTSSLSSSDFMQSGHFVSQNIKNEGGFLSDNVSTFPSAWTQRQPRNSLEVTKDILAGAGIGGPQQSFESAVSPPPHLDGHLVHAVGGHKPNSGINHLLSPPQNNHPMSRVQLPNAASLTSHRGEVSTSGFFSPDTDVNLLNPGTFPGPPCVELASCNLPPKSEILPPLSTTPSTLTLINGITSSRMEASVTATHSRLTSASVNTSTVASPITAKPQGTPFSPNHRVCVTPDKTQNPVQHSPPKRPRSASINTAAVNSNSLKRSSSTLSEDSGIGELPHGIKSSPNQQKTKEKAKSSKKLAKSEILSKLLTSDNFDINSVGFVSEKTNVGQAGTSTSPFANIKSPGASKVRTQNPPMASSSILTSPARKSSPKITSPMLITSPMAITPPARNPIIYTQVTTQNGISQPALMQNQTQATVPRTTFLTAPSIDGTVGLPTLSSASFAGSVNSSISSSDVGLELDEIFDCYESIIGSNSSVVAPSTQQQLTVQQPAVLNNRPPQQPQNSSNILNNMQALPQQTPMLASHVRQSSINSNSSDMLLSPVNNPTGGQPMMASPQTPTNQIIHSSQGLTRQPSVNAVSFRRIVPSGQETCPNRVVSSGPMLSPKPTHRVPLPTQFGDLTPHKSWDGREPLVDLGSVPPPSGINPRMAIPNQSHLSPGSVMPVSNTLQQQSPINNTMNQVSNARLGFQSGNTAMHGSNVQLNMLPNHQNINRGNLASGISPVGFSNSASPNNYHRMRPPVAHNNNSPRPMYNTVQQQQQQIFSATGSNLRARLLRQPPQQQPIRNNIAPPPYQSDLSSLSGAQQFSFNQKPDMTRYNQRPNGALLRQQRPASTLQRSISSPIAQNQFNQINPARFTTNPQPMGQFTTMAPQQAHFPNSSFNNDASPSMGFESGMRSHVGVLPQHPNQFSIAPSDNYTGMSPSMGTSNFPNEQISAGPNILSVGKPQLKRTKSKKPRKKLSTEESPWPDQVPVPSTAYKQRPLMQMTIGNMHQRPQPTYNSQIDGSLSSNAQMMSPQSGNMQTYNLNSLISQNKPKMMNKMGLDSGVSPGSFHTIANPISLQQNQPITNNWSGDVGMTPSMGDDGMFNIFDGNNMSSQSNAYSLDGFVTAESNSAHNSNVNNNKNGVSSSLNFTVQNFTQPNASNVSLNPSVKLVKRQKSTVLLESLLKEN